LAGYEHNQRQETPRKIQSLRKMGISFILAPYQKKRKKSNRRINSKHLHKIAFNWIILIKEAINKFRAVRHCKRWNAKPLPFDFSKNRAEWLQGIGSKKI